VSEGTPSKNPPCCLLHASFFNPEGDKAFFRNVYYFYAVSIFFHADNFPNNLITLYLITPEIVEVEIEVNLRPIVSRQVCLGVRHPYGTSDQFFFLLEIFFKQLQFCYFVAPSLTRGRVCNVLYNCFWALKEHSHLCPSPAELTAIFYCLIWDTTNLEGQVPVFISPRNKVAQLYPRALGSLFVASYDSQGYGGDILTRLHTRKSEIFLLPRISYIGIQFVPHRNHIT
jgi:hypothetical protein